MFAAPVGVDNVSKELIAGSLDADILYGIRVMGKITIKVSRCTSCRATMLYCIFTS